MISSLRASHDPRYSTRLSHVTTDAVIIRRCDWKRVKCGAVHVTAEEQQRQRQVREQERRDELSEIQTRRSTLISSELSPATQSRTHETLLRTEERDHALRMAERQADEDLDEIKHVRSQMVAAEARTERDTQLVEGARLREIAAAEEAEWADQLEQNRRDGESLYATREQTLREQRIRGRAVIQAQIEERMVNGILEAERRDREAKALREQRAAVQAENDRIQAERQRRKRAFLRDCLEANEAQRQRRLAERARDREEAQMVIEVQAQRSLQESALEQERADQRALKEREVAEIRSKQQRAVDMQAQRDEAQAIKIQKEKEENDRAREQADADKKRRMAHECRQNHETMVTAKRNRLIEQETIERAEFERIREANRIERQRAMDEEQRRRDADRQYRQELGEDAERRWQASRIDPEKKVKEGQQLQQSNAEYLAKINRLRDEKLRILRTRGVPEKYLVDIQADRFDLR